MIKEIKKGDTIRTPFGTYEILSDPEGSIGYVDIKGRVSDYVFLSNEYAFSDFESDENAQRFLFKIERLKAMAKELG